jgi:hypothetical protein
MRLPHMSYHSAWWLEDYISLMSTFEGQMPMVYNNDLCLALNSINTNNVGWRTDDSYVESNMNIYITGSFIDRINLSRSLCNTPLWPIRGSHVERMTRTPITPAPKQARSRRVWIVCEDGLVF